MKKVYFNHIPWNIHPVYQEMLGNPPEWVEYINKNNFWKNYQDNTAQNNNSWVFIWFKISILNILKKIYFLPNITFRKLPWDITYSCQSIPLFWDYILDIDCYEALNRFSNRISENFINKFIVKFFLKQKRCKQIVFWSDNAMISFRAYIWNSFDYKIQVLYPAIKIDYNLDDILKYKNKSRIDILFVGRYFGRKWWKISLEIAERILDKYENVDFHFITQAGEDIINKYQNSNRIFFTWLLPRGEVIEYFKKADIYLMPTFQEIFGMVFLEAFAYWAIPVSTNTYAINNIIDDWIDWFVVDYKNKFLKSTYQYIDKYNSNIHLLLDKIYNEEKEEIIRKIFGKIEFLINNKEIRTEFMKKWFKKVENWKFSLINRNRKLINILSN